MGAFGGVSPQTLQHVLGAGAPEGTHQPGIATPQELARLLGEVPRVRASEPGVMHPVVMNAAISGGYVTGTTSRSRIGLKVAGEQPELWYRNLHSGLGLVVMPGGAGTHVGVTGLPHNTDCEQIEADVQAFVSGSDLLDRLAKAYNKLEILKSMGRPQSEIESLLAAELSLLESSLYKATAIQF